jgi:hypothetical protein
VYRFGAEFDLERSVEKGLSEGVVVGGDFDRFLLRSSIGTPLHPLPHLLNTYIHSHTSSTHTLTFLTSIPSLLEAFQRKTKNPSQNDIWRGVGESPIEDEQFVGLLGGGGVEGGCWRRGLSFWSSLL